MGQPAKVITNPVQDFAVLRSCAAVDLFQFPVKLTSAYVSNDLSVCGPKIIPLSLVSCRYLQSQMTASPCNLIRSSENLVTWCVEYKIPGLVLFLRKFNLPTTL